MIYVLTPSERNAFAENLGRSRSTWRNDVGDCVGPVSLLCAVARTNSSHLYISMLDVCSVLAKTLFRSYLIRFHPHKWLIESMWRAWFMFVSWLAQRIVYIRYITFQYLLAVVGCRSWTLKFACFNLCRRFTVDGDKFISQGRSTSQNSMRMSVHETVCV